MDNIQIIILAAGKGTRMKSSKAKVMHEIAAVPMVSHVVNTALQINPKKLITVISDDAEDISDIITNMYSDAQMAIQKDRLGTGHAVKIASEYLDNSSTGVTIILYGDTPFISSATIKKLVANINEGAAISVVGFNANYPGAYGRLITEKNKLKAIIEYNDASQEQRDIKLCNSGIIAVENYHLKNLVEKINNNNAKSEYYLTDIVTIAAEMGLESNFVLADEDEVMGVNSKDELIAANKTIQKIYRNNAFKEGVTFIDAHSTYLSLNSQFGKDVVIEPNVYFGPNVIIGDNVRIRSFSYLENCVIENDVVIGPFARIRPGSQISTGGKIGNFVEIKNSVIGKNSKVNHLSYIGDSDLEAEVNIGAGTITCNYDGFNKYKTSIGKGSFIGSNTALVAPVTIGQNSIVAAGSIITNDVEEDAIAVARAKQSNLSGRAKSFRNKKEHE